MLVGTRRLKLTVDSSSGVESWGTNSGEAREKDCGDGELGLEDWVSSEKDGLEGGDGGEGGKGITFLCL